MPIIPGLVERVILSDLNLAPALMLDFLGAQAFRALGVAIRLGIFEALADGPMTSSEVARRTESSERGTQLLLDALESLGYVQKRDECYANTPMTSKWLLRASPNSMAEGIPFFESMVFD